MIQATRDQNNDFTANYIYADLYDVMTSIAEKPLIKITSQSTNKSKVFRAGIVDTTNKNRYMRITYQIAKDSSNEALTSGVVFLGSTEYPYGFYDVVIYQNNDATNLDPDNAIKVIYKTVMNLKAVNNDAITYTEYTETISSPTYITNTI
jgi:hypothetical protein